MAAHSSPTCSISFALAPPSTLSPLPAYHVNLPSTALAVGHVGTACAVLMGRKGLFGSDSEVRVLSFNSSCRLGRESIVTVFLAPFRVPCPLAALSLAPVHVPANPRCQAVRRCQAISAPDLFASIRTAYMHALASGRDHRSPVRRASGLSS